MKKTTLFFALLFALCVSSAQKTWFVGGTGSIAYSNSFGFSFEPLFGYEFTYRWAIGSGIGLALVSDNYDSEVFGVAEPFIRFCAWHNEHVFFDLKATAGFGFDYELLICKLGIRPSLRCRLNEHWEMAADLGLFGANYDYFDGWRPAFGLTSAGLWFAYRF